MRNRIGKDAAATPDAPLYGWTLAPYDNAWQFLLQPRMNNRAGRQGRCHQATLCMSFCEDARSQVERFA
jgi:hypothetical protein